MKISFARGLMAGLVLLGASHVNAQLLNISSGALQSQNTAAVSCTIVGSAGSSWRGMKALIVFSEANSAGSNPVVVARLLENGDTVVNDNWTDSWVANGKPYAPIPAAVFQNLLRTPFGPTDAALLISVPMGWRLCVSSSETSGGDALRRVALSVTDVTDAYIAQFGKSADNPATVKGIEAGTPNLIGTFARMATSN